MINFCSMPRVIFALFFAFVLWIIYEANHGANNLFFEWVANVPYGDKLGHFVLFGILGYTTIVASKGKCFRVAQRSYFAGAMLVLLFAIYEEVSQIFLLHRTFDLVDFLFSALGIFSACFIARVKYQSDE